MTPKKIMEGVFAVQKPTGISSAQALRDLQRQFDPSKLFAPWLEGEREIRSREAANQRNRRKKKHIQVKIGHGGTLDPLATGVLIAGVGKGTKSLQDFLSCTKVYETIVLFGTSTDTYDRVGKVLKRAPYAHVTKELVEEALEQFRGKFMQLPPLFSALKMNGKPLYEYAREGKEIPREIERRPVEVLSLEMLEWMEGGTHEHVAPTDEAGYAEINVANKLWRQENAVPGSLKDKGEGVESGHLSPQIKTEEASGNDGDDTRQNMVDEKQLVTPTPDNETSSKGEAPDGEKDVVMTDAAVAGHGIDTEAPSKMVVEDGGQAAFEQKKRKLSEDQDGLVHERPASKRQAPPPSTAETAMMSGGLSSSSTSTSPSTDTAKPIASHLKGPPAVRLRMTVTSGFYVRSLCHDLGAAVGSAALMAELERTRQGDFELGKNVVTWEDLAKGEEVWGPQVEKYLDEWHSKYGKDF
ncbi:uncharacterized protein L3040_002366 [Drepanopeziza brunnea f. sp. 'multigermtubi']|uniref:uncharacterized protein n=1 Tax=Drepanopeziza brunnea f. sp. 'multigermtubi' TaxID=698441 RepID=UPI002387BB0B|nr:hypothetical protein L3040_002366 [Drepanopeziza brunnea f. sp. 'multigermtubi']